MNTLTKLICCVVCITTFSYGQQNPLPSNTEVLDSLQSAFKAKWKADSLKAIELGIPLSVESESQNLTFMGFEGNTPLYTVPTTSAEIQSYFGQNLWASPYQVEGQNQIVGMWEAADAVPDATNDNLLTNGSNPSRIIFTEAGAAVNSHANNVAWRLAGDAAGTVQQQGIAPKVSIKAWKNDNVLTEIAANASSLIASNHSYAYVCGYTPPIWDATVGANINWYSEDNVSTVEDFKFGRYSPTDQSLDATAYSAPYHSIVISAGNDRGQLQTGAITAFNRNASGVYTAVTLSSPLPLADGGALGYDCIPLGAVGKNTFTIGACNTITSGYSIPANVVLNTSSVYGPTDDGRIKPDFVAASTFATSGAAPQVSGSIALLQELSFRERGTYLLSATMKALLAHTAFEAGNVGPDYENGWGLINPKGAADLIIDQTSSSTINESALSNSGTQYFLVYSDGSTPITATLCWTDPAFTSIGRTYGPSDLDNTTSNLVNDLDMRLVNLNNVVQASPYILNPATPSVAATTGDNFRDNIEKIYFASPSAGWYAIKINHKGTLGASQAFSLVISGAKGGECASSLAASYNTWNGSAWSSTFVNGQNVVISGTLSITSNTTFGDAIFEPGAQINVSAGIKLTITGNVQSFADVSFPGSGSVELAGTSAQKWCGGAVANNLIVDNSTGAETDGDLLGVTTLAELKSGTLTTNGQFGLLSSSGSYAQLHENGGSISGAIEFQQTITSNGWHHIASPVQTTIGDLVEDMNDYILAANGGSVYTWGEASGSWVHPLDTSIVWDAKTALNVFFGASGSRVFSPIPFTVKLKGTPNSGTVNNTIVFGPSPGAGVGQGWNHIANPYTDNLDWNTIKANFGSFNINNFYYVWDAASSTYKFHDGTTTSSGIDPSLGGNIAPGQSFFVKLNDAAAQATTAFNFTNSNRTTNTASFYKTALPLIQLKASQNDLSDSYYIAFETGKKLELEPNTDAFKLFSPVESVPQVYQFVDSANSIALNFVGLDFEDMVIPVSYDNTSNGTAQIEALMENIDPNWAVFLEDTRTKEWHNLRLQPYQFSHEHDHSANRFLLHINKSGTLDFDSQNDLAVWGFDGNMKLQLTQPVQQAQVVVLNSIGEVVHQSSHDYLYQLETPFTATGVFIVQVRLANGKAYTTKWVN